MRLESGLVIDARYRLVDRLGKGGMGEVWRATHLALRNDVAIKIIPCDGREEAVHRAMLEARATALLDSPYVVRVFDLGEETDFVYIAMELLSGEPLDRRLHREKQLSVVETIRIAREVGRGIDHAHARGVVHRDLKPSNIFLMRSGDVETAKVVDFGVAKLLGASDSMTELNFRTKEGLVVGTPAYMSREQVLGEAVDHRSDLWSLAIILYECLAGELPWNATNMQEQLAQIASCVGRVPKPLPSFPGLVSWFRIALSPQLEERFATAEELVSAFELAVVSTEPPPEAKTTQVATPVALGRTPASPSRTSVAPTEPPTVRRGLRRLAAVATALGLLFAVAVVWNARAGSREASEPTGPAPPPRGQGARTSPEADSPSSSAASASAGDPPAPAPQPSVLVEPTPSAPRVSTPRPPPLAPSSSASTVPTERPEDRWGTEKRVIP